MRVISRVVEAVGADYGQWRVLTRVMLKNDFRSATGLSMGRTDLSIWRSFLIYAAFGGFVTLVAASVTVFLPGLMLPGTIVATQVGVVLAMIVLIDFQTVVISPDDYDVLAHQPVSSGTYFLVKLTNVLIFTLIIGALLGGPSVILLLVAYGPLVAAGGTLALVGITTATTLAILCTYAGLLSIVHPRRLVRVLSTVQMIVVCAVMLFPIYIDNLFGPALERMMSGDGSIPTPAWVLLAPPAWFASLLPLSAGDWSPGYAVAAVAGIGSVVVLFFLGAGKVSVSYAERLGAITSSSERRRRFRRPGHATARRPLTRRLGLPADMGAVATLARAQFRDDMTFRMAVMGLVPAILVYSFIAMRQGPLPDPFVELGAVSYGLVVMNFAAIGFPLLVVELLSMSKSWRASWIYFALPADRARLVVNAGLCVTLLLVAPTALVIGGVLIWSLGSPWHAAAHAVVLGVLAHLAVQARLLIGPHLPFSRPPMKGGTMAHTLGGLLVFAVIGLFLPLLLGVVYSTTAGTVAFIGLLLLAAVAAPAVVRHGIRLRMEGREFAG